VRQLHWSRQLTVHGIAANATAYAVCNFDYFWSL